MGLRLGRVATVLAAGGDLAAPQPVADPVDRLVAAVRARSRHRSAARRVGARPGGRRARAGPLGGHRAARVAGVQAVAPLAACFLPAFVLVGVVPVVAGVAGSLLRAPS